MSDQEDAKTEEGAVPEASAPTVAGENAGADGTSEGEAVADALDLVIDVPLRLTVELGCSRMLLRDVLALDKGSVVDLDRGASDPVDILVNGRLIARGELKTEDDRLGVSITEIVQPDESSTRR